MENEGNNLGSLSNNGLGFSAEIVAAVDKLRNEYSETQDLYREVCALLFFRFGITPTANKLYQLVRRGSMSAPAEALRRFWGELREKSRVRIEHPDLPSELANVAGELVANLWKTAQAAAATNFAAQAAEARRQVTEAEAAQAELAENLSYQTLALESAQQECQVANAAIQELRQELSAAHASVQGLHSQLSAEQQRVTDLEQALVLARQDFALELEKSRDSLQLAEERYAAAEKRALMEIERERANTAKLEKTWGQQRETYENRLSEATQQHTQLQVQLAEAKQIVQNQNEKLHAVQDLHTQQTAQLQTLQKELEQARTLLAQYAQNALSQAANTTQNTVRANSSRFRLGIKRK